MAQIVKARRTNRKLRYAEKSPKEDPGASHIIVKFRDEYKDIPYTDDAEDYLDKQQIIPWHQLKEQFPGIDLRRLYTSVSPERIKALVAQAVELDHTYKPPNFLTYFLVQIPPAINPAKVAETFLKYPSVETAYVDPPKVNPTVTGANAPWSQSQGYPNQSQNGYLNASPKGINACYAWNLPGGDGADQDFIDIERGWTFDHEDLPTHGNTPLVGANVDVHHPHGTATLGVVCGMDNSIGIVGIAPHIRTVRCVSYVIYDKDLNILKENLPDALEAAINTLSYGGVLLLEAQLGGTNLPVELLRAEWDGIRLATALGITVVEAAGNALPSLQDLDAYPYAAGDPILRRGSGFCDSGAIMVGAGSSASPHTRLPFSNYGSRIDCYAQGEAVTTAWSNQSDPYVLSGPNAYTTQFDGTSSAAAIIAGVALAVQGMVFASRHYRFGAWQMRSLLSDPQNGTISANPITDRIGVMPDLKKLSNAIGAAPDVYIRDFVGDTGDPHTGPIAASPDIILLEQPAQPDPDTAFGEQNPQKDDYSRLGGEAKAGQPNYIYVRMRNRGGSDALNVTANVYWAEVSTLVTPDHWTLVGQVNIPRVSRANILTVSDAITWPSAQIPATGHYCFVGIIGNDADPGPLPAAFTDWDNYLRFIRENNNVTWRNFQVVDNVPNAGGFVPLAFLAPGAPDQARVMRLEIVAQLPEGSRAFVEAPISMYRRMRGNDLVKIDKRRGIALIPINPHGEHSLGDMLFEARSETRLQLLIQIPPEYRSMGYQVFVRQLYEGQEVGRVTWRLVPMGDTKLPRLSRRKRRKKVRSATLGR